jgi:hypothetical protein
MSKHQLNHDYETYREIMSELLNPISHNGLDEDTLYRLYKSKLVYLENLRAKCFIAMNKGAVSPFSMEDFQLIMQAINENRRHLRNLILLAVSSNLAKRKVV